MKTPSLALLGVLGLVASGCWSPDTPVNSPQVNPLDEAPAAAKTDDTPSGPVADTETPTKKGQFDHENANVALGRAAKNAHSCVDIAAKDAPHGDATMQITFNGSGKSTAAQIPSPFDGTSIGQCATRAFIGIIVPPFDGADVVVDFQVDLKPDVKAGKPDAKTGKKK